MSAHFQAINAAFGMAALCAALATSALCVLPEPVAAKGNATQTIELVASSNDAVDGAQDRRTERKRFLYQKAKTNRACDSAQCYVYFPKPGDDRRVEVTNMSCSIQVPPGAMLPYLSASDTGDKPGFIFFKGDYTGDYGGFSLYSFNAPVRYVFEDRDRMYVAAFATAEIYSLTCYIAGQRAILR